MPELRITNPRRRKGSWSGSWAIFCRSDSNTYCNKNIQIPFESLINSLINRTSVFHQYIIIICDPILMLLLWTTQNIESILEIKIFFLQQIPLSCSGNRSNLVSNRNVFENMDLSENKENLVKISSLCFILASLLILLIWTLTHRSWRRRSFRTETKNQGSKILNVWIIG